MPLLDTRVPAVLLRIDRNPFHHGTLGAVRSLGRAGVEVHLVADVAGSPVRHSRFVRQLHPPPHPGATDADIAAVLLRVAARVERPAVLIPMDDAGAVAVSRLREELAPAYLLPQQPGELPGRVADKAELAGLCRAAGVPHPETVVPESAAQAAQAAWRLGLPVVAKWSRPWLLPGGSGLRSTVVLSSTQEARDLYLRTEEAGCRLLLQEFLAPGAGLDWFFHGYAGRAGAVLGGGPGRKLLSWPRGAGLTAVGEWVPNATVTSLAERLTADLGYRGILDLDFRRCASTGAYHLLDFNPRPGAQFRLFSDSAGLDVVRAQHLDLTHRPPTAGAPRPGRAFVVENYAPLAALRPAPHGRELAWHAVDDPGPGRAMWGLWCRHVATRVAQRLRRTADGPGASVRLRVVRQAPAPSVSRTGLAQPASLTVAPTGGSPAAGAAASATAGPASGSQVAPPATAPQVSPTGPTSQVSPTGPPEASPAASPTASPPEPPEGSPTASPGGSPAASSPGLSPDSPTGHPPTSCEVSRTTPPTDDEKASSC